MKKKRSERRKHCARAGCSKVRTPPARCHKPTDRTDNNTLRRPLSVYIKQQAMLACFRLQVNAQWFSNTCGHSGIKNILTSTVPISHRRCDKIIPRYMFNKNYVVDIPKRSDWIGNNIDLYDDIVCYTDGSKLETTGSTGASVYDSTHDNKHTLPLGKYATVFQAELYAILTCVSLLCNCIDRSITICSDSQAALKSISAAKITSHLVWETAMTLQQLSMHNCIRLLWVEDTAISMERNCGWTRKTSRIDGLCWTRTCSGIISGKYQMWNFSVVCARTEQTMAQC